MLNKIIHFSLNNRILILVASVLLMVGGAYTAFHTEVDVFPDLNAPTVVVMTEANGMAAEEVEQLVTFPVETAVNGATNVRRVRSSSTNGFSVVWVEFDWGTDIYLARQIVSEKLAVVSEELPDNVGNPTLGPQSSILGELMIIGLTADSTSMLDLRTLADWTIRPRLLSMGGVAQVAVLGGDIKEYQIQLDPARMKHYGVTLAEVMAATRDMNQNANGGVIYEYGNEYIVRGALSSTDVDKLARAVVKKVGDFPITLGDVAHVGVGAQQPKLGCASVEGKPAVLITVTKQPNTGTLDLTEKIDASLADLQKNLPADVKVSTDIYSPRHVWACPATLNPFNWKNSSVNYGVNAYLTSLKLNQIRRPSRRMLWMDIYISEATNSYPVAQVGDPFSTGRTASRWENMLLTGALWRMPITSGRGKRDRCLPALCDRGCQFPPGRDAR